MLTGNRRWERGTRTSFLSVIYSRADLFALTGTEEQLKPFI